MGFEPMVSSVTGKRPLQAGPMLRTFFHTLKKMSTSFFLETSPRLALGTTALQAVALLH